MNAKIENILNRDENIFLNSLILDAGLNKGCEMAHIMYAVNFKIDICKNYTGGKNDCLIGNLIKLKYTSEDWEGNRNEREDVPEVNNVFKEAKKQGSGDYKYFDSIIEKIFKYKKNEDRQTEKVSYEGNYNKFLDALNNMEYIDYLNTNHWKHFRKEAIKFYNNKCQICGKKEENLNLHHSNYGNRGRETFNDVTLLCSKCHNIFHKEGK